MVNPYELLHESQNMSLKSFINFPIVLDSFSGSPANIRLGCYFEILKSCHTEAKNNNLTQSVFHSPTNIRVKCYFSM